MLRTILILVAMCWMGGANAQDLLMERTILMHDGVQSTQMIFLGRSGKTYLRHPSSDQIIPGRWSTRASGSYPDTICLRYGGSHYNPVTCDDEQCTYVQALLAKTTEQAEGDFFGLSGRTEAPFQLSTRKTTIAALASKGGCTVTLTWSKVLG